jgi:hypothetical protein
MEVKSMGKKTFQLTDGAQQLGKLIYENLFFMKAEIELANAELYEVKPVGIFGTSIAVKKDGTEIANLKMNWRGQIVFSFEDGQEFILKAKGVLQNAYVVENKEEEKLIQFDAKFNWSKFQYNYDITYNKKPGDMLIILLGVYAANYLIASMSGAAAGLG